MTRPGFTGYFPAHDVEVGAADGSQRDTDDRLANSRVRPGYFFDTNVVRPMEHCRLHCLHKLAAASCMILTIVCSTSCATRSSCGVLNIASRVVGFSVAKMVLPPSS